MLTNRSMPASTVIPTLPYDDVVAAARWLEAAFGLSVRLSIGDHRVQMSVGDGAVVLVRRREGDAGSTSLMVRIADVDAHRAKALAAGARVSEAQSFPYGERQYTAIDCGGHAWSFSQSIEDVAPESWGGVSGKLSD